MLYVVVIIESNIENEAYEEWIYSLSDSDVDTLVDLYESYPLVDTTALDNILLVFDWMLGGGLFIVFLKVWRTESINNETQMTLNYNTFKRDIVGVSLIDVQCSNCNTIYKTKKNVGIPTETICPVCQTKGFVMYDE